MILHLSRWCYGPEETLGLLRFPIPMEDEPEPEKHYQLWTCEPSWQGNMPFLSCVPDGQYPMLAFDSPEHPACWILTPVPGRTGILIHPGNGVADSRGCICPGVTRSDMKVWQSRDAMDLLNYALQRDQTHTMVIGPAMAAKLTEPPPGDQVPDLKADATIREGEPIN